MYIHHLYYVVSIKGKSKAISVPYSEVCKFVNVDGYWKELDNIVQDQKDFFLHHITIRYVEL